MSPAQLGLVALGGLSAGFVNALAGGGTLLSFPALTAIGVPPIAANITNTVALCPGYLGATLAQRRDLRGQAGRMWALLPAAAAGGLLGGVLLLRSSEHAFRSLVPFLILLACGLLAMQDRVRAWLIRGGGTTAPVSSAARAAGPVAIAAIYGGYFGAGLSVIVLAVLGVVLDDTLTRLNALKQTIALTVNFAAVMLFVVSGHVVWPAAAVMAAGALIGGAVGGRLAGAIRPAALRTAVVVVGLAVGVLYLL